MTISKAPTDPSRLALLAYALTALALGSAWHIHLAWGLWLGNSLAALVGITTGSLALRSQAVPLLRLSSRSIWGGLLQGVILVTVTQLFSRLVLMKLDIVRGELLYLYALLRSEPGPLLSSPVLTLVVIAEELVFRGATTTAVLRRFNPLHAAIISTALYTLPLLASGSWVLPIVGIALGGIWVVARIASGSLVVPLLSHALFSLTTFVWLPVDRPLLH